MNKNTKQIVKVTVSLLFGFYLAFLLMKIIEWYGIPLELTYKQIYGAIALINIVTSKTEDVENELKKSKEEKEAYIVVTILRVITLGIACLLLYVVSFAL